MKTLRILLAIALGAAFLGRPSQAQATSRPPGKMTFQGFLTDSSGNPLGSGGPTNVTVFFTLYKNANGTTLADKLWAEQQIVTVDRGHFNVLLGEGTAAGGASDPANGPDLTGFFIGSDASDRYLGIRLSGQSEISPRMQFLATPYTSLARYATELVGSSGASLLKVTSDKIGINLPGAATPASQLEVNGTVTATAYAGNGNGLTNLNGANLVASSVDSSKIADGTIVNADISASAGIVDTKLATISTAGKVSDSALSANVAVLNRSPQYFAGNQIIRPSTPSTSLGFSLNDSGNTERGALGLAGVFGNYSTEANPNDIVLRATTGRLLLQSGAGGAGITIGTGNTVGIGTPSPTQAKLVVNGSVDKTGLVGAYINANVVGNQVTHGLHPISIYTSGSIWCGNTVIATSDARVKRILGRSDGSQDLNKLLGIEITDFRYKDQVQNSGANFKKVIAQQVEKVFPQAVSRHTGVVPDVYQPATYKDGWLTLQTDLKTGDRVKLVNDKAEEIFEVLEVREGAFRTALTAHDGDKVFVYGREVNDFRTVDYEAIAMLNVSATQQIKKEKDAEIKSLREENAALVARLDAMEREAAQMKKLVAQLAATRPIQTGTIVAQASR